MFETLRIASRSALTLIAAFFACLPLSATAAATASRGDIVVVTVHGTVDATMAGMTVPLSAGAILQLPATVRTHADGAVELRQGTSTFAAAGNTELEIPQSAAEDGLIERIVQIRGNAFYSIGKRTGTRLRVEAPYLVAVIKGTQFNVAAQEDSTTIALFEGHLEVRASDDSDVVNLEAGEIAIRRRNDVSISVLRLNAARGDARRNQEFAARPQSDAPASAAGVVTARNDGNASPTRADTSPTDSTGVGIDVGSLSADVNTSAAIDLPAGNVDVSAGMTAAVGEVAGVDVGAGASVDLPAGSVDVSAGATVAAGSLATVDVGTAAAVDVPAGAVDVGAGAAVAAGNVTAVDLGAAAAVDVPAGTANVGVDTSVAGADLGAAVGVDAGADNVGADVNVGPVEVGLSVGSGGVDLDLGGLLGRKHRN